MVQEPALSLIVDAGGRELFNAMNLDDAHRQLGGAYEFMGVSVRAEERDDRLEEMKKIGAAREQGVADTRTLPPEENTTPLRTGAGGVAKESVSTGRHGGEPTQ